MAAAAALAGPSSAPSDTGVREAMLRVYFHGVDDALARQVLGGPEAVGSLRRLLGDPDFPRRDNVVAFLAHLDAGDATRDLLDYLSDLPLAPDRPEEDRAVLLAPQALGRIAARGDRAALEALLSMTADGSDGGPLARAAARGRNPGRLAGDLMESALRGLAYSGAPEARLRLEEIGRGRVRPDARGRDLARPAAGFLTLFDAMHPGRGGASGRSASPGGGAGAAASSPGGLDGALAGSPAGSELGGGVGPNAYDTNTTLHDSRLTYANHPAVTSPMGDTRLNQVLAEATLRAASENFSDDLACCIQVTRSGSNLTFGANGDGLDIIDNDIELNAVLNNGTARVKVVRQISWCSGPGTNIIGCAWINGNGMSLVRLGDLGSEAVLWIHEYGHNVGLNHVGDNRNIMFGTDTGANSVLTQQQCTTYHFPLGGAGITPVAVGFCTDDDQDGVRDTGDNCLGLYNPSQANADADPQGDACDGDDDNDQRPDGVDCAPLDLTAWSLPGEAGNLQIGQSPGDTIVTWSPPADAGGNPQWLGYDVILSGSPTDFVTEGVCVEADDGPNTTSDSAPGAPILWQLEGVLINARLGSAVASGDFNHDGRRDVIVSAPRLANGEDQEGRVYMHPGTLAGISPNPSWQAESNYEFAGYGVSIAAADVNGDDFDDVLVGAVNYDDGQGGGGVVFVYHGSPAGPSQLPSTTLTTGQFGASFGQSVASAGDLNNDGYDDVIVGAPGYDNAFFNEGQAFVFMGSPSGLSTTAAWTASGGQDNASFGASVAADGRPRGGAFGGVLVGAPLYDNGSSNEGAIFAFHGSAGGLATSPSWSWESDQALAELGRCVAAAGDVNADGYGDVLAGAPLYDDGQADEGRAFLFRGGPAGLEPSPAWQLSSDQAGAQLGMVVAPAGDASGDGVADVIISAPGFDNGLSNVGRVAIVLGGPLGLDPQPIRRFEADQPTASFGVSVAGLGDITGDGRADLIIGSSQYDNTPSDEGWAFIYPGSGGLRPPPDSVFYYLIRAENACGGGPIGFTSAGAPIGPALSCP